MGGNRRECVTENIYKSNQARRRLTSEVSWAALAATASVPMYRRQITVDGTEVDDGTQVDDGVDREDGTNRGGRRGLDTGEYINN